MATIATNDLENDSPNDDHAIDLPRQATSAPAAAQSNNNPGDVVIEPGEGRTNYNPGDDVNEPGEDIANLPISPPILPIADIPPALIDIITRASSEVLGIPSPRDFQYEAVAHCVLNRDTVLHVSRRTSDGKTFIPQMVGLLLTGVVIYLEPLVGLASDQVDRSSISEHNVWAHHVDEHKKEDAKMLRDRLLSLSSAESRDHVINLLIGPKALTSKFWLPTIQRLAKKGLISAICIDECHYIEESGRHFRREFQYAMRAISQILLLMPRPCPRILMSATITQRDVNTCTRLLRGRRPNILSGPLDRRRIKFLVRVSGDSNASLIKCARNDFKKDPISQQIWYTHSRSKAEGPLRDRAEKLLEDNRNKNGGPRSIVQAFVGTDGIMMKTATMDAIKNYANLDGEGTLLDPSMFDSIANGTSARRNDEDEQVVLPKVQCIIATKSAEAGINGPHLKFAKMNGLPASLYELVQQLGRVDRTATGEPGSNTYEVHIDFGSYTSIFLRIMAIGDANERKIQLLALHTVLDCLVKPTACFHSTIEEYFEWLPMTADKAPCIEFCSFCIGEMPGLTKRVSKLGIISFLTMNIIASTNQFLISDLIKRMKSSKHTIFHEKDVPSKNMMQIHALALQLVSNGIIAINVKDKNKIGKETIAYDDLFVTLPHTAMNRPNQTSVMLPGYLVPENWATINTYDEV